MKRLLALLLTFALAFTLFGCKTPEQEPSDPPTADNSDPSEEGGDEGETGGNQTGDANHGTGTVTTQVITDRMVRFSCKDGTGYDKSVPEPNADWKARLYGVELGELRLHGCEKTEGGYRVVSAKDFAIRYNVTQNLGSLVSTAGTKNGAQSLWVNRDENVGAYDTNLKSPIGVGAYYVKITYTDGTAKELSRTNFFEGVEKGAHLSIVSAKDVDTSKTIQSVAVTLLYETYAGAPGFLGVWWHEYTNWRCEYTYKF